MSVVTGIVVVVSVCEGDTDRTAEASVERLNDWLSANYREEMRPLKLVADHFGGNKHPQLIAAGAGLNHLDEDAFAEAFLAMPWTDPENVLLIMQPEDGATRVFRPAA